LPALPVLTTGVPRSKPDPSGSIAGKRLALGPAVFVFTSKLLENSCLTFEIKRHRYIL
jgi:hypothetical protein